MGAWEDFRLVVGYLPEIDTLPEAARELNLPFRVAAVLREDGIPHSPLYWELIEAIVGSLTADSVFFEFEANVPLRFTSVSLMRATFDEHPEFGRPFNRATCYVKGKTHALIDVEPYNVVGGPWPYSDSWTFAIYRETEDIAGIRDACYEVCRRYGLPITEEMQGLAVPKGPPLWKRIVRWLFPEWVN
jgi:hypothetical protein